MDFTVPIAGDFFQLAGERTVTEKVRSLSAAFTGSYSYVADHTGLP